MSKKQVELLLAMTLININEYITSKTQLYETILSYCKLNVPLFQPIQHCFQSFYNDEPSETT